MNTPDKPVVSVIIPTYNSAKTLPTLLVSIKKQTYRNIEIIVVDRYSEDDTVRLASKFGAHVLQAETERAQAKNIGLSNAKGKYVLFLDSDMELTPTVVQECVNVAERDHTVAAVVIPEITTGNSLVARIRRYERYWYQNTYVESPRFYRRDLALQAGGFDPTVIFYEEATLAYKLEKMGYRKARIKSYILHHEENLSLKDLLRKRYYYGKSLSTYSAKYRDYATLQLNPGYRLRLFLRKEFWQQPHMAIAVLTLKSLEYLVTYIASSNSANAKRLFLHRQPPFRQTWKTHCLKNAENTAEESK